MQERYEVGNSDVDTKSLHCLLKQIFLILVLSYNSGTTFKGTPCKRLKDGTETVITTTTITVDPDERKPGTSSVLLKRSNRSMSESNILDVCLNRYFYECHIAFFGITFFSQ